METGRTKKVVKVKVGAIDRIPKERKHFWIPLNKFPGTDVRRTEGKNTLVAGCACTHDHASRCSYQRVPKMGPMSTNLIVIGCPTFGSVTMTRPKSSAISGCHLEVDLDHSRNVGRDAAFSRLKCLGSRQLKCKSSENLMTKTSSPHVHRMPQMCTE